ncbi:DNA cytosine methyltransferase, partial [Streptomyces sp. NPDC050211]|uniref:DNA cytosine methyltransferase n=1 Tax=Streptomyces sp. NPDC050211 TaxID=3154932 RepID=UPI00342610B7
MTAPRIGSVCTGYGGLDEAVQAVFGGSLAWVADNDPGASRILAHRHPGVPNLGDITAVGWHDVEPVDIYVGGYPCQP